MYLSVQHEHTVSYDSRHVLVQAVLQLVNRTSATEIAELKAANTAAIAELTAAAVIESCKTFC